MLTNYRKKYHDKTPIWWYTYECFLHPMLNRALRLTDVDIIIKMGFFIGDLHRHIKWLHSEQFKGHHTGNSFTVYRGQGMSKADFDQMTKIKGGLMSFNNFLSTSKNRSVSLDFARYALPNLDMVGILFVMTIDPAISTTPFASIVDVSFYQDAENEVLFSMNTVFRIGEIKPMSENHRLFEVDLIWHLPVTMIRSFVYLLIASEKRLFQMKKDGIDWVSCYLTWVSPIKPNKFMKLCLNRQLVRVRKGVFTNCLDGLKLIKENMKR